jgi:hypothetical protein
MQACHAVGEWALHYDDGLWTNGTIVCLAVDNELELENLALLMKKTP